MSKKSKNFYVHCILFILIAAIFVGCSPETFINPSTTNSLNMEMKFSYTTTDKKIGETHTFEVEPPLKGSIEITLNSKKVFENLNKLLSATNLPNDEFISSPIVEKNPERYIYILFDINIQNINATPKNGWDEEYPFNISFLHMVTEYKGDDSEMGMYGSEIVYFSDHPLGAITDYYHFNIEPGESIDYQLVFYIPKVDYENNNIWLAVGGGTGQFFLICD